MESLFIYISEPELVERSSLPFSSDLHMAACTLKIIGFEKPYVKTLYGTGLRQTEQEETKMGRVLKGLSDRYDFYFEDGAPYFQKQ